MKISSRILKVIDAPIDKVNRERIKLESEGHEILNLGQAVPDFGPPAGAVMDLMGNIIKMDAHLYTGDPGLPELRMKIATVLRDRFKANYVSDDEIIVTCGANHAFLLVLSVLCEEKTRFGLFTPFYLNHKMAIEGMGGEAVEIMPGKNLRYSRENIEKAVIENQIEALVLVNPSNPTGKVFTRDEIETIHSICREHSIWLIADEVYREFVYPPATMISAGSFKGSDDYTIIIGSFSKEYGMTGWRVGWLRAPQTLIPHLLKVQDYSVVCAPHASQLLAIYAMNEEPDWAALHLDELKERRDLLIAKLKKSGLFEVYESDGGFFVWCRPLIDIDSDQEVFEIMKKSGVCIMPGTMFGESWRGWLRISFGSQRLDIIEEASERIIRHFE